MLRVLDALQDSEVRIELSGPRRPARLTDGAYEYIVPPINPVEDEFGDPLDEREDE